MKFLTKSICLGTLITISMATSALASISTTQRVSQLQPNRETTDQLRRVPLEQGPRTPTGNPSGDNLNRIQNKPKDINYECKGIHCSCSGDDDCNEMFLKAGCGDIAVCYEDGTCECLLVP
jgi:hypothetical protein